MSIFREKIIEAVARGWCAKENREKEMDSELACAIADELEREFSSTAAITESTASDDNLMTFYQTDPYREILRIEKDGKFFVDGRLVTEDVEVYKAFKEWLSFHSKFVDRTRRVVDRLRDIDELCSESPAPNTAYIQTKCREGIKLIEELTE